MYRRAERALETERADARHKDGELTCLVREVHE